MDTPELAYLLTGDGYQRITASTEVLNKEEPNTAPEYLERYHRWLRGVSKTVSQEMREIFGLDQLVFDSGPSE